MRRTKVLLALLWLVLNLFTLMATELPMIDQAIEQMPTPILLVDAETQLIVHANPMTARFFSIPLEQLPGRSIISLLGVREQRITNLNGKTIIHHSANSRQHQLKIMVQELPSSYLVIVQDLTEQEGQLARIRILLIALFALLVIALLFIILFLVLQTKMTRQLQKQKLKQDYSIKLLQNLLDADKRINYVCNESGSLMFVNAALEQFLGMTAQQILGHTIKKLFPTDLAVQLEKLGGESRIEETLTHLQRMYRVISLPIVLPDGTPGSGTFIDDITDYAKQEEYLQHSLKRSAIMVELLSSSFDSVWQQMEMALLKFAELTASTVGLVLVMNPKNRCLRCAAAFGPIEPMQGCIPIPLTFEKEELFPILGLEDQMRGNALIIPYLVDNQLVGIVILGGREQAYTEQDDYQAKLLFQTIHTNYLRQQKEEELEASKQSLRLILDSTAEGIYGIDEKGVCTFCNASALLLLGYADERELLGEDMHTLIHHHTSDLMPISEHECPIRRTLVTGQGSEMENEVFWRKDGTYFDVQCFAYPQVRNNKVVGAVVTFTNNTERKANLAKIEYLSFHDQLTGTYNRAYFDEALRKIDKLKNLPISIIVGDVNGLKLTNDVFGHNAGDELLVKVASVLSSSCRASDVISRIGGDEFVILLPQTKEEDAKVIGLRIMAQLDESGVLTGRRCIALGWATKTEAQERIHDVFDAAEDHMYRQKTMMRTETQRQQLGVLIDMLFTKAPKEREHALRVQKHAMYIGELLEVSSEEHSLISRAGYYHDIGKVVLDVKLINAKGRDAAMQHAYQEHASAAYRILNTFEETLDLAPLVLNHHERWDGTGYLKGLSGEQIPYISRILRLAEIWERENLDEGPYQRIQKVLHALSGNEADPFMVAQILEALKMRKSSGT